MKTKRTDESRAMREAKNKIAKLLDAVLRGLPLVAKLDEYQLRAFLLPMFETAVRFEMNKWLGDEEQWWEEFTDTIKNARQDR